MRLVVDAAYPSARLVRALTAFMPQKPWLPNCACAEIRRRKSCLFDSARTWPLVFIIRLPGHGNERCEFVAVAHPDPRCIASTVSWFHDPGGQMQVVIIRPPTTARRPALGARTRRWTVSGRYRVPSVASGLGFAWLPRHMIERELRRACSNASWKKVAVATRRLPVLQQKTNPWGRRESSWCARS